MLESKTIFQYPSGKSQMKKKTYLSSVRVVFSLRASARDLAPAAPMLFISKLRRVSNTKCQRLSLLESKTIFQYPPGKIPYKRKTYPSVCSVVFTLRASARDSAPAAPILLPPKLCRVSKTKCQ